MCGRVDRVIIQDDGTRIVPTMLTTRPTKRVPFQVPFSFVMGPHELSKVFTTSSLEGVLREVISLDDKSVKSRLSLVQNNKLDHILSANDISCQLANLQGMLTLLRVVHAEAATRFEQMLPQLESLVDVLLLNDEKILLIFYSLHASLHSVYYIFCPNN
jgi:hypothetical protein